MRDGHLVSRQSDFIIYSVEAEFIDRVVAQYGPCTSSYLLPRTLMLTERFKRRNWALSFRDRRLSKCQNG